MTDRKPGLNAHSGSPPSGEPEYLVVGRLNRPHGLVGDMLMDVITDFPERLRPDATVFVGETRRPLVIAASRPISRGILIRFEGIDSPEAAGMFRTEAVYVRAADRPRLPAGQYYHHELLGSHILDEQGTLLGTLTEILQTGANDVYVVQQETGKELLLPAISGVILHIDIEAHTVRARIPAGLQ